MLQTEKKTAKWRFFGCLESVTSEELKLTERFG
jgi:hypothetical protein